MASIQKIETKKGWQYVVSFDVGKHPDGRRKKSSRRFPPNTPISVVRQFAAQKDLERSFSSSANGNFNMTFEELAELYFSTYVYFLSPSTLKGYKGLYYNSKSYGLKNYFGKAKVRNINSRELQLYINTLSQNNLSAKSIKNYWGLLRILFDLAVQEGVIQRESNPMLNKISRPKQEKKEVEAYNLEEMQRILKLADEDENPDIKLILNLALLSGIRRGEMAGLRWENVNFDDGYIYICESRVVVEGGKEYIKSPKTQAGIRKIYIPEQLVNVLKEYHTRYLENKLKYGKKFKDKGYVLSKPDGEPFSPQGISNNYLRFMERHKDKIRYLKFHGLRHTFASILINNSNNVNIRTVQKLLGHSDVSLTLSIYSHSFKETEQEAAKCLQDTLKQIV